jgi:hypothetical protein
MLDLRRLGRLNVSKYEDEIIYHDSGHTVRETGPFMS